MNPDPHLRTRLLALLLLLGTIVTPTIAFSDDTRFFNDTTHHANQAAANRGRAHRGMTTPTPPAPSGSTKADDTPSAANPAAHGSASGMGATDNTMSGSIGSEAVLSPSTTR